MREQLTRRAILGAAAGGGAALALAGCGAADALGLRHPVRVAVSWSAAELQAFNAVLDGFGRLGYDVEVLPLGDDIGAAFGPRTALRPDIVLMPQPGTVIANAGRLAPVPPALRTGRWPYAPVWDFLRPAALGVPFKMAHESMVWYRRSVFARYGVSEPRHWSDWLGVNARLASAGVPPLAVAAGDGWMLTQTFDNVLLGAAPQAHRGLVDGTLRWTDDGVSRAFRLLGRMWAAPGTLAGGVNAALVRQFPDAVVAVFGHQRAAMVVAPDFAEGVIRQFAPDLADVGAFPFPLVDGDPLDPVPVGGATRTVIGGDIAVLTAPASAHAQDLVIRLAGAKAPLPWITGHGGFIAANLDTPRTYRPVVAQLAGQLTEPGRDLVFNLSDELGALGGREGLWRVLQDFLVRVGHGGPGAVPDAARDAAARMDQLASQER